jgi:elongation factor Ts
MIITTQDIRTLREATGAGIMECREALTACNNSFDEAIEHLKAAAQEAAKKEKTGKHPKGKYSLL